MSTVKELMNYLGTLPEDTDVCVAESFYGYEPGTQWTDLDLGQYEGNADFISDGRSNTLYLGKA